MSDAAEPREFFEGLIMHGRKLDAVTDAVMELITKWIKQDHNILQVIQRGPAQEIFRQTLQDTIERESRKRK